MTVSSGFFFGLWTSSLLSVVGATAGAIILFLVARLVAGDALRARAGPSSSAWPTASSAMRFPTCFCCG